VRETKFFLSVSC